MVKHDVIQKWINSINLKYELNKILDLISKPHCRKAILYLPCKLTGMQMMKTYTAMRLYVDDAYMMANMAVCFRWIEK